MFEDLFTSKKNIGSARITASKQFGLTLEKIAEEPRKFKTSDLQEAINNVSINSDVNDSLLINTTRFILKDLFFQIHQSGLYNRQLRAWKGMGHTTQVKFFQFERGFLKKTAIDLFMIDFLIDTELPYLRAFIPKGQSFNEREFKKHISMCLRSEISNLRSIVYVSKSGISELLNTVKSYLNITDDISKYESIIPGSNDVRLNIVSCNDNFDDFTYIYPALEQKKTKKLSN